MGSNTTRRLPGNISFVRYKLGLSQQQLADILGVSRSLVAMVETGKRKFPGSVATIYLEMCRVAATINPEGSIIVKRGRKPASDPVCVVTNYDNPFAQEGDEGFVEQLQRKKTRLRHLYTGLQFKKKTAEERRQHFSDQQVYVTAMRNACISLLHQLPESKLRDKYEFKAAVLAVKQIKLKQQLKKYDAVALLQVDYQLSILERQLEFAEKAIIALQSNRGRPMSRILLNNDSAAGIAA